MVEPELRLRVQRLDEELEALVASEASSLLGEFALERLAEVRRLLDHDHATSADDLASIEARIAHIEDWLHDDRTRAQWRPGAAGKRMLGNAAGRALGTLDRGKKAVTQEVAWEEVNACVDSVVEVVRTQHAMILDLLDRVSTLERRSTGAISDSSK
jgi:hypothetical protein